MLKNTILSIIALFLSTLSHAQGQQKYEELVREGEKAEANLDKPLVAILDTILQEDQNYRLQIDELETKYAWDSKEMQALWQIIHEKDSVNVIKVKIILDERGWLGPDIIGRQGNQTLFLVIQHADIDVQKNICQ